MNFIAYQIIFFAQFVTLFHYTFAFIDQRQGLIQNLGGGDAGKFHGSKKDI